MEKRVARQRRIDATPSRVVVDREPVMVPGRRALTDHQQAAALGEPDRYTLAVQSAERQLNAIRSVALPAFTAALRKKNVEPLTKEIEVVRTATQLRHLLLTANAQVVSLEKIETHDDPVIRYLRGALEKLVRVATRLGAYRGAEEMIPQRYEKPKPQEPKGSSDKPKRIKRQAIPATRSTSAPTKPAAITKPSRNVSDPSPRIRAPRLASGTRAPATRAPIQRKGTGIAAHANVHDVAARGVESASAPLPFASIIQRAFGRHDISNVRAQIGGAARTASRQLGAKAYATGNLIAFAHDPDLHTAAHEAAHVIQQRHGVSLAGGIDGGATDAYERHADEVADAVVAGRSVEHMFAGQGAHASSTVQRKTDAKPLAGFALYLSVHETAVRAAVQTAFAEQTWPDPAEGLTYQPGGERIFARQLAASIARKLGDATAVKKLCYPGSVQDAIDVVGDSKSWEPEFGERLAYTLTIAAATALKDRVGPRYREVLAAQVERPTLEDLRTSRSMDMLVGHALTQSGVVDARNVAVSSASKAPASESKNSKGSKESVPSRAQLLETERQIAKQLDLIRSQAQRVGLVATLSPAYEKLSKRVVELVDGDEAVRAKYAPAIRFQHTMLLTLAPRVKPVVHPLVPLLDGKLVFSASKRARRDQLMRAAEQYMRAVAVSDSREKSTAILDRIVEREKFQQHQALAHEVASSHSATRGAIRDGRADHETTVAEEQLEHQFAAALIGAKSSPYDVQKAVTLAGEVALRNRMSAVGRSLETLRNAANNAGFRDVSMWRKWLPDIKSLPEIILDVNDHLADVNRVWEAAKREKAPVVQDDTNAPADWSEWQERAVGLAEAQRAFSRIAGDQSIGAFIQGAQRQIRDQQFLDAIKGFAATVLLTVATGMGAGLLASSVRAATAGETLVGAGIEIAINASLNTVTQLSLDDSGKSSGGWTFLENFLMETFTRGLMSRVAKLQKAAEVEARAYATLPNLSDAEREVFESMQFTGLDFSAQMLGGIATQWAAHQLTDLARQVVEKKDGKAQPQGSASEAVASTVYQQGMSIALGKFFHGRYAAWKQHQAALSKTRFGDAPETKALAAEREQFYRKARELAEAVSPDPAAGDWLVQREIELCARERAAVTRLSTSEVVLPREVGDRTVHGTPDPRTLVRRIVEEAARSSETASRQEKERDAATIYNDHSALHSLGSLPPEVMLGARQQRRVTEVLQAMTPDEYGKLLALADGLADPIAKGFLYKAVAAGNSLGDVGWLAAEMVGRDRGWLIDNLTLGDPRGVGGGVKQQWSTSCNASMTITLRGNYDPVFALRLRHRNMSVGEAHEHDPHAMNMNQADLERQLLERTYGGTHPASPANHKGVAAPRDSEGVGRYADDLLNEQAAATGLDFKSVENPSGADVVSVLERSLDAGMQVPLVIGNNLNEQAHYVLVQGTRAAGGEVEFNIHDPWMGESSWVKAKDIANGTIPGMFQKVGTIEVPTAANRNHRASQEATSKSDREQQPAHAAAIPAGRVSSETPGLFDSIQAEQSPPAITIEHRDVENVRASVQAGRKTRLQTEVQMMLRDGSPVMGHLIRKYDPISHTLELVAAFLPDALPRWVQHEKALDPTRPHDGVPLFAYVQMQQLKVFGIHPGELTRVKLSNIINVMTIVQVELAARAHNVKPQLLSSDALLKVHSIEYAETPLVQSGHRLVNVELNGGTVGPIGYWVDLMRQEGHVKAADGAQQLMKEHKIDDDDRLLLGFDLEVKLAPSKGKEGQ